MLMPQLVPELVEVCLSRRNEICPDTGKEVSVAVSHYGCDIAIGEDEVVFESGSATESETY